MKMITIRKNKKGLAAAVLAFMLGGGALFIAANRVGSPLESRGPATIQAAAGDSLSDRSAPGERMGHPSQKGLAAYDEDGDGVVYQGGMHPEVIRDEPGQCPVCGMNLTPVRVDGQADEGTVRISPATIQNMGVRTTEVQVEPLRRTIRATGRFEMDEQGMHTVSLKVGGWVETLHADFEGAIVKKGQPLLELYSPELVATQEEYLLALRNARRLGDTPDAQRLLEAARRRLAYWDLTEAQIDRLKETGTPQRTITFYAPASGEVMHKNVTGGQRIEPGQTLMQIADISTVWLIADVYEQDLPWIGVGTEARVKLASDPGQTYRGRVDHIYHMMDAKTRTAKARIELSERRSRLLKPGAWATVYLEGTPAKSVPVVPAEAIVSGGEQDVVVQDLGEGRFRPVPVKTGLQAGDRVQILSGLNGGERVVTSAQFLIDSEARLQSAVGAMSGHAGHGGHESHGRETTRPGDEAQAASSVSTAASEHAARDIHITVGPEGFEPARIELQAGVPARLVFTRATDATCAKQVHIPAFSVEKTELPLNEAVTIELNPGEPGTFTFVCGMDMLTGTLVVTS